MQRASAANAAPTCRATGCTACCTSSQFIHIGPDEADTLSRIPAELLFPAPRLPLGHVVPLWGPAASGRTAQMLIDNRSMLRPPASAPAAPTMPRSSPPPGSPPASPPAGSLLARPATPAPTPASSPNRRGDGLQSPRPGRSDRTDAVRAAAAFLDEHPDLLPDGATPANRTQLAVLAIEIHHVFLRHDEHTGRTTLVAPDAEVVRGKRPVLRQIGPPTHEVSRAVPPSPA